MTYSKVVMAALKKAGAKVGDRVSVMGYEGLLMPSPEIGGSPDHVIIKMDNGYNIGIRFDKGVKIKKSERPEPQRVAEEFEAEVLEKHAAPRPAAPLDRSIAVFSVGGTIASKIDYRTGAVAAAMTSEDLASLVPELGGIARLNVKTLGRVMSEDMDHSHWQLLAREAAKALKDSDGVIIPHGTDTMGLTAAALSFMLRTPKPVVLTGAQRSTDRGSADSAMNLVCSARAALSDIAEVGVCMHATENDDYCFFIRGTKVRKMHTSMRSAFRPVNDVPLAMVWPDGKIDVTNPNHAKRGSRPLKVWDKFNPNVALVKALPLSNPKTIDWHVKQGVKGLIIEGTGLGHVPTQAKKSWIPSIRAAVDSGVFVGVAAQPLYGEVNLNVYTNQRLLADAGAVGLGDMLPETAYVKLGWVMGDVRGVKKVTEWMLTNVAGELNTRLSTDTFLF
jgi:glutamyl-tRNA(Gln) amidotransferase subunit D